jgi:hypothetical protein
MACTPDQISSFLGKSTIRGTEMVAFVTQRPRLHAYRTDRRLTKVEVGAEIGVSATQVGRYELPFEDSRRQIPTEGVMGRIHAWSAGELKPADFYLPALSHAEHHGLPLTARDLIAEPVR